MQQITNTQDTDVPVSVGLRKQAYSDILKNFTTKNFLKDQIKTDIFLISAQNIDCGYSLEPPHRGGSNEYHNLCFEQK